MTNLSKELCEVCGIKPKWIKYETETTDGCINLSSKKVYPDFEQPENFVKLLNLIYRCGINQPFDYQLATLSADEDNYWTEQCTETFEQRYLETLLYSLSKNYDCWDELFFSLISKAIRAEEWIYG